MNLSILDNFAAAVFDLDGTLVNSMPLHIKAWQNAVKEYGVTLDTDWLYAHGGVPSFKIAMSIIKEFSLPFDNPHKLAEIKTAYYLQDIDSVQIYPEMLKVLEYLKNKKIPCGIGTGTLRSNVERIVANTPLKNYIQVIVSADDVTHHKPHPETFVKVAELLNAEPKDCVVFEDTPLGITAGENGGFSTILVKNGIFQKITLRK